MDGVERPGGAAADTPKRRSGRLLGAYMGLSQEAITEALREQATPAATAPSPAEVEGGGRESRRLGQILIDRGVISREGLASALVQQRKDRLKVSPLFASLPESELDQVARIAHEATFAAGEVFIRAGDQGRYFYVLAGGTVKIFLSDESDGEVLIAISGPGETIGEMGYFSNGIRSASVRALEPVDAVEIAYEDLTRVLPKAPALAIGFLGLITDRLRESNLRSQRDRERRRTAERSFRSLSTLLDMSEAVTIETGMEGLIERIVRTASRVMNAERASLFLLDPVSGDLWSKVMEGEEAREVRIPRGAGLAGHAAQRLEVLNIPDAYQDPRFDRALDLRTGYRTRSVLCGPVIGVHGGVLGVIQVINKREGVFDHDDEVLFRAFGYQAAISLENWQLYRRLVANHEKMAILLEVATSIGRTLDLGALIGQIVEQIARILACERSSFFVLDPEREELFSMRASGAEVKEIRFPATVGLAGHTARTGEVLNIKDAYEDPRFNSEVDRQTGYRTRTVLCVPVKDRDGRVRGVCQAINKVGADAFDDHDIELLQAMGSQIAIAVDNAQLYARTNEMKRYLERVQASISNGIVTFDQDLRVITANDAAARILAQPLERLPGVEARRLFGDGGATVVDSLAGVLATREAVTRYDLSFAPPGAREVSVNVTASPLTDSDGKQQGLVAVLEDVTREKRIQSTMTRYMAKDIVERMLKDPERQGLGGVRGTATILFSDIREFTTVAEGLSAEETLDFLNQYFTVMVDEVFRCGGILDKFIGDALMAVFGVPYAQEDDAIRAARCALGMVRVLEQFNLRRQERGLAPVRIGLGLNTDEVISGNLGSEKRMEYTVIGDGVNLSSRLEAMNKAYGTVVIAGERTAQACAGEIVFRQIDAVRAKGKSKPTRIYEVLGERGHALSPAHLAFLEGFERYQARDFPAALELFQSAARADPVSAVFASRCEKLIDIPPPEDWDGVWTQRDK